MIPEKFKKYRKVSFRFQGDRGSVKTNASAIVTKVEIQVRLAEYGSPLEFIPRKRDGEDTLRDFSHTLIPSGLSPE